MDSKIKRIYAPMTESAFYILYCLQAPQHGYGINQQVKQMTAGAVSISAGTMYGTLAWKFKKVIFPRFYQFEKCTLENVVYCLDYQNKRQDSNYHQIFKDYGWEYCQSFLGWLYFRKPVTTENTICEYEIFSDDSSRIDMLEYIVKTRMLPLLLIFFACLLPNLICAISYNSTSAFSLTIIFGALTILYIILITYCGTKLHRIRSLYDNLSK